MGANQVRDKYGNAIDDDENTLWSTPQQDTSVKAKFPQNISIDMGKVQPIIAFTYLPRQDKKAEGIVDRYIMYISDDGTDWQKFTEGEFSNIKSYRTRDIAAKTIKCPIF